MPGAPPWRWGEWIWLTGPSGLHWNSPQGLNISILQSVSKNILSLTASGVCRSTNFRDVWWWQRELLSARWGTFPLPSRCTSSPRCSFSRHMDWTKGYHWISCAFPRPHAHGLLFVGISQRQFIAPNQEQLMHWNWKLKENIAIFLMACFVTFANPLRVVWTIMVINFNICEHYSSVTFFFCIRSYSISLYVHK